MLERCRALDLTDEKGFLCGKILADLGVEVIKVERPDCAAIAIPGGPMMAAIADGGGLNRIAPVNERQPAEMAEKHHRLALALCPHMPSSSDPGPSFGPDQSEVRSEGLCQGVDPTARSNL